MIYEVYKKASRIFVKKSNSVLRKKITSYQNMYDVFRSASNAARDIPATYVTGINSCELYVAVIRPAGGIEQIWCIWLGLQRETSFIIFARYKLFNFLRMKFICVLCNLMCRISYVETLSRRFCGFKTVRNSCSDVATAILAMNEVAICYNWIINFILAVNEVAVCYNWLVNITLAVNEVAICCNWLMVFMPFPLNSFIVSYKLLDTVREKIAWTY
jgi:hypothetical protein